MTSPERVVTHSFLPFISYSKETPRYKRDIRKVIPKPRPISYAAHLDSHIYAYYAHRLGSSLEAVLLNAKYGTSVSAYRSLGKCNVHFAVEAFAAIERLAPCVAIALDVTDFFGSLDHSTLYEAWCRTRNVTRLPDDEYRVFRSITRYATVDRDDLYKALGLTSNVLNGRVDRLCSPEEFRGIKKQLLRVNDGDKGIPQGSPISAVASNVYMSSFDETVWNGIAGLGGLYWRYCDDLLLIVRPEVVENARTIISAALSSSKLEVNDEKTDIVRFERRGGDISASDPLQYLGLTYDGMRILIRSKSLARFHARRKSAVSRAKRDALGNESDGRVFRRALYERFSHLGRRNFVSYAFRASDITGSSYIKGQLARHWAQLDRDLTDE